MKRRSSASRLTSAESSRTGDALPGLEMCLHVSDMQCAVLHVVFACIMTIACGCSLARVKDVSGSKVANEMLREVLGKADFDMEEYDKAMAAAFDESYYEVGGCRQGPASPVCPPACLCLCWSSACVIGRHRAQTGRCCSSLDVCAASG
jgi:hypothetical protein